MLDLSAQNLHDEIRAAERLRNLILEATETLTRGYVGRNYRDDWREGDAQPENHAYEYITLTLGRLVADNPAVAITSHLPQFDPIATALEFSTNKWIGDEDLQTVIEGVVTDSFFSYGVTITTFEPDPLAVKTADGLRRMKPVISHMPNWRYFRDPASCPGIKARYEGHVWIKDRNDLEKDDKVNQEALAGLMSDGDLRKALPKDDRIQIPDREQIVGYEVWVPEVELTDHPDYVPGECHGTIYTLATVPVKSAGKKKDSKAGYIREPRPFYGPATGPYTLFGGWPVPASAYPLAPLAATKEQADELNAHIIAIMRSAMQMKDIVLVDSQNTGLKDKIKDGKHGHVYGVRGFTKGSFESVSIGGPSSQQIEYSDLARQRLDRASGMSDALRGNLDPNVTATANNIAQGASSVRIDTQIKFIKRATAHAITKAVWYMYHSEFFASFLPREAAQELGIPNPIYAGGPHPTSDGLRFEDLTLTIEPYSMERVDPAQMQARVQQVSQMAIGLIQAEISMPVGIVDFDPIWDNLARAHNFNWVKSLINRQALAQFQQQQAQAAAQGQQKPPAIPYKDAPGDVKAQLEAQAGMHPSAVWSQNPPYDPDQPFQSGNPATAGGVHPLANPQNMLAVMNGGAGAPGSGMNLSQDGNGALASPGRTGRAA